MAFCRRCGDIVSGARCKCGGVPVAPVVEWNKHSAQGTNKDRWSQTYVSKSSTPSALPRRTTTPRPSTSYQPWQSPRSESAALASRVSEHIASATNSRPPSPLKQTTSYGEAILSAPDVIPSPYTSDLSKVYGSVLQPKETLESFHCHVCSTPFPPDATIYPDPTDTTGVRFLCRSCFAQNGGSRGDCVECARPVLILKSEGGFVENAGRVWHKKCFQCSGCNKNIGDNPTVDLLGRPSCADCFDTCLDRRDTPRKPKPAVDTKDATEDLSTIRPSPPTTPGRSRQGSSTIEELEHLLGIRSRGSTDIKRSRLDSTHLPDEVSPPSTPPRRQSASLPPSPPSPSSTSNRTVRSIPPRPGDVSASPRQTFTPPRPTTKSPTKVTPEAIEAVKRRFLKQADPRISDRNLQTLTGDGRAIVDTLETPTKSSARPDRYSDFRLLRHKGSASSIRTDRDSMLSLSSVVSTPSLISDYSDTATMSSGLSSPPPSLSGEHEDSASLLSSSPPSSLSGRSVKSTSSSISNTEFRSETFDIYTKDSSNAKIHSPPSSSKCAKCTLPLFDVAHGGRFVSVPEPSSSSSLPRLYHADCFRCRICDGPFEEKEAGRAVFVRGVRGACHLDCAPTERSIVRKSVAANVLLTGNRHPEAPQPSRGHHSSTSLPSLSSSTTRLSSRYSAPLQFASNASNPVPRFGISTPCPGCSQSVSPMERGVVPGPQGQRWHSSCLVCGGKQAKGRGGRRVNGQPGCGKQLDSSAKRDTGQGGVWCRDCLSLLPFELRSSQASPTRPSPFKPKEHDAAAAGSGPTDRIASQHTGSTTLARQFTGASSATDSTLAKHITGGRLSPTKQLSSPTKVAVQFTGGSSRGTLRPRPKSAIGMRGEGRGMFLVQQLTGGAV
ncbi:hypothetical protein BC834DRAFT_848952 [Gloeopeniophorella convolvens]|nr:hypothetical protein BC834DRAFT_848952 [Gloeopeniophorella convolvens]